MSAILSADDLNDFISPGVACIKPVETLPKKQDDNPYEVTTEDKLEEQNPPPAQISLTDCLACSGCVTSAEAVLVSLQSHAEVLNTLDANSELRLDGEDASDGKIFVASVSPQVRASLAATYGISEKESAYMIEQFLTGPNGLRAGGQHGSGFSWVVDTNIMRQVVLELSAVEVTESLATPTSNTQTPQAKFAAPRRPILSSSCPGWICYAEKTHPHVLPHLSRLKSPQALTGTLLKTILSKKLNISPSKIWHLAIMPCFDKKLEASRQELTDASWKVEENASTEISNTPVRDVDCVITSKELLMLASSRNIDLPALLQKPLPSLKVPQFPDQKVARFLSTGGSYSAQLSAAGTSGGYLYHILTTHQSRNAGSVIQSQRGRNADVVEYTLVSASGEPIIKAARYYGFRNIQNLVRKLKPARASRLPGAGSRVSDAVANGTRTRMAPSVQGRVGGTSKASQVATPIPPSEFAYVEVMACPGGCTNGGGQIRLEDAKAVNSSLLTGSTGRQSDKVTAQDQRAWLACVDEAYFSDSSDAGVSQNGLDGSAAPFLQESSLSSDDIQSMLKYWCDMMGRPLEDLVYTTYRKVESDVGKSKGSGGGIDTSRVAELAGKAGGGW